MYVVLLGPPGSGKGTQGELLAQHLGIYHLSTGELFREILKDPMNPLYNEVAVINQGRLVSDQVVIQLVADFIRKPGHESGILFDGFPRTVVQAQKLDKVLSFTRNRLTIVIYFDVSEDVLFHRILGRRVCPECHKIFHIDQGYSKCPDCNIILQRRADDNRTTIRERLTEYKEKTMLLQRYYQESQTIYFHLHINDVSKSPEEVQDEILHEMSKRGLI